MSSGSDAYNELNEHHRKLAEGPQTSNDARRNEPLGYRPKGQNDSPTQLSGREAARFTEEQQKFLDGYWQGFSDKHGEHAVVTPEHRAEAERLVLKNPSVYGRDFADLERRESYIEQARQLNLQESDRIPASDQSRVAHGSGQEAPGTVYSSFFAEREQQQRANTEREQPDNSSDFEDRRAARIADTVARRRGDRENEHGDATRNEPQERTDRVQDQQAKSSDFEARRAARIADTIARRQADRQNERGGREE